MSGDSMNRCILVNRNNPIKESLIDRIDFTETTDIYNNTIKVEKEAYDYFIQLRDYCLDQGIEIGIASAFRNFDDQRKTYEYYYGKFGNAYCERYVAPVGCSEHHTGLALDLAIIVNNNKIIENIDDNIKTSSRLSDDISKDLKRRGMSFVGTTIIYSYLYHHKQSNK